MPFSIEELKNYIMAEIASTVAETERTSVYPAGLVKKLAARNYLLPNIPLNYGGLGLTPAEYGIFTFEVGKVCQATRALYTVNSSLVAESVLRWGTEEQKLHYLGKMAKGELVGAFALSEPKTGSDAGSVKTSYVKTEHGYILSGTKKWISFGGIAGFFLVIASDKGKVFAFLVNRNLPGISVEEMKGLLAGHGAHIAMINFDNVELPAESLLGPEGNGMAYVVSTALDHGRYSIAWGAAAICYAAIEAMVTYSRKRDQFDKKIYKHEVIQHIIGESTAKMHSVIALCEKAGTLRMQNHPDSVMETNAAKYISSRAAVEIASASLQVHGGNGCWNIFPAERLFREARILEIIEGTSQVQEKLLASFALRRYFNPDLYNNIDI